MPTSVPELLEKSATVPTEFDDCAIGSPVDIEVCQADFESPSESAFAYMCRSIAELKNIKFALASFVINNLRRRYRRSILGFAWSLLNPLLTMAVMTAVFSLLWHASPKTFGVVHFHRLVALDLHY